MTTLESLCEALVDCEHKTAPEDSTGEYYAVGTPAMRGNIINYAEARRISAETFSLWTRRLKPRSGDILFAREAPVGPAIQIPEEENVAPGQRTVLMRIDPAKAEPKFIYYLLTGPDVQHRIHERAAGSTVPHLNVPDIRGFDLGDLPDPDSQRAIAEVLGSLDDKIAANNHVAQAAEDLLRARFNQLGMMKEFEADALLSEIFDFAPRRSVSGPSPRLDMQAIPTRGWNPDPWDIQEPKGGARFMNGDTLLARITPCLENRKTAYVDDLPDGAVGVGSTEFIVMRSKVGYPLPLSFFVATNEMFRSYAVQHMVGTSGRQRVAAADLAAFPIKLPDTHRVAEWGELAVPLFSEVRARIRESRTLAALRDALLPELMSGRLKVSDAEDQVEEVL